MQTFATTAPLSALLNVPAGRIRFVATDESDQATTTDDTHTTVEVLPADASKGRDVKAAEAVQVTYADGVLRIEAPEDSARTLGNPGSVEVTVHLPAGSHLRAKTASAEFRAIGRLGEVEYDSAHGSVKVDETAGGRITLQAGDIAVGRLGGPAEIRTQKGNLMVAEAVRGTVRLSTDAGDVTVGAARGVSATLDAGTSYGRIHNSLANTEGSAAALTIHATTSYGDITARAN
ncbi:DUF4097 family beta strand repeat-containing protein [Streptomyces sp. NPDC101132]|uniref:DUF4097 family beta strand repeat-containing protein n=1 Tax=Streptomyces sp. NPDC101132 TaxID=3366110 RepID=UPI00382A7B74